MHLQRAVEGSAGEHPAIGVKLLQCFLASLSEKIMRSNELRKKAAAYDHNAVNEILEE